MRREAKVTEVQPLTVSSNMLCLKDGLPFASMEEWSKTSQKNKTKQKKLQIVGDLLYEMAASAKPSCFNAAYFRNAGLQANHTLNSLIAPSRPCVHPRLARPSFAFRKHAEDLRNVSTKKYTERIFHLGVCTFLRRASQQVNYNLCVQPGCELPFFDFFALLFKINYCSVLVSVPLEDELEATFPSSSSLIFKVAKSVPKLIFGASLARKVAIHNC